MTFQDYLIQIGKRSCEFCYTDQQIHNNKLFFKECWKGGTEPEYALSALYDHIKEIELFNKSKNHDT